MENKVEFTLKESEKKTTVITAGSNVNVNHMLLIGKTALEGAVDVLVKHAKEFEVYNALEDKIKSEALKDIEDIYNHMKEYIANK